MPSRLQQQFTRRFLTRGKSRFSRVNFTSTQIRRRCKPLERLTLIGRAFIPKQHRIRFNGKRARIVKDTNVSVHSHLQLTFAMFETNLFRRVCATPCDDVENGFIHTHLSAHGFGPENAESESDGADATPCAEEVALSSGGGAAALGDFAGL